MIRGLCLAGLAVLLAGCMVDVPPGYTADRDPAAVASCEDDGGQYVEDDRGLWSCLKPIPPEPETAASCTAQGGRWARGGILGAMVCYVATPDAGQACTTSSDCTGFCMAKTRTCSEITPMFGCFEILEDGQTVGLCVD